jgi:hypothetical protein
MEKAMRSIGCFGAAALVLVGSLSAMAQEPSLNEAQKQSFPAQPQAPAQHTGTEGTTPPPPLTQPKAPIADQAAPAAVGPAQANTAGAVDDAVPLGATRQTMPSTISKENAALDKLPTTALQLPLTEDQKRLVMQSVAAAPKTQSHAGLQNAHIGTFLPIGAPAQEFSGELKEKVPPLQRYKYIKLDDRVLIVDPPYRTVVGDIKSKS